MLTLFEQAVAYIKAGDIEKGKQLLAEALKQNPRDENAWLWMTKCVTDAEQKRYCFERVLKINPQNQHAIEGLGRLGNHIPAETQHKNKVIQKPSPKKTGLSAVAIVGLLVAALAVFCICGILMFNSNNSSSVSDDGGGRSMAYIMCQEFVEERLVAPATAKFPKQSDIETFTVKDKKDAYQIRGYVDSQNRMGALLRMHYVCEVSYVGNDKWHLDYLQFDE